MKVVNFKLTILFLAFANFSLYPARKNNKIIPAVVMTQLLKSGVAIKSPRDSISIPGQGTYVFKKMGSKAFWSLNSPR